MDEKCHGLGAQRKSREQQKRRISDDLFWVKEPLHSGNISDENCYPYRSMRHCFALVVQVSLLFCVKAINRGRKDSSHASLHTYETNQRTPRTVVCVP